MLSLNPLKKKEKIHQFTGRKLLHTVIKETSC
jgi:hypothetical protein